MSLKEAKQEDKGNFKAIERDKRIKKTAFFLPRQ